MLLTCTLLLASITGSAPAAPPLAAAPAPAPVALRVAGPDGSLPAQAQRLADGGQPLEAFHLLAARLADTLPARNADPRQAAEAELAALQLVTLAGELDAWPEVTDALGPILPRLGEAPPQVAFLLHLLSAAGLRHTGRPEEAAASFARLGYLTDFRIIGPFDNERGSGFDVAYAPETTIDLNEAVAGKERDVHWRSNPGAGKAQVSVPLHEMLRPAAQVVAYLATTLSVQAPREVVLCLGSSCALKVFLNGTAVLARKVERPHFPDQDRVVLALQPGVNQLLIKACVEDGPWTVEARLTGLDGLPVTDLVADGALVATPSLPFVAATGVLQPQAREVLAAATDDAAAARLLALYHLIVHPDDKADRSARVAAERAVALDPSDPSGQYLLARANDPEGASAEEMQVNPRLSALQATLALQPTHVAALLDLAEFSMALNPLPERADDLTARALAAAPESWRALELRARYLQSRDRDAEADALRERAEQSPEGSVRIEGLVSRAGRLQELGRTDEALSELSAAFERHAFTGPVLDSITDVLIDRGEPGTALLLTQRALAAAPCAVQRMLETAERLEYAGQTDEARVLVDRALTVCPESTPALIASARMFERGGDIEAAQKTLGEVVRLDPGNTKARRHRQLLLSGEDADRFETPYRRDAVALAATPMPPSDANDPVEVLDHTTVWRVHPDGTEHRYEHIVMRALNQGGVKQLDSWYIPAPDDSQMQVFNVRVIHADGSIERAPAPRGGWKNYDLPALKPGDLVDVEYRVDQSTPGVFGEYFGTRHEFYPDIFDGFVPTRRAELVVLSPKDLPIHVTERRTEGMERSQTVGADGMQVLSWVARDLQRPAMQGGMPARKEIAPVVDLTTFKDWNAFATWWYAFIEKEFVSSPAMKAKVAELTEGLTTEQEKVTAIARFCGQEIRYNAWPFGTHGYEPFSAATIFERRFGDCKDKSILMKTMLAEIGVKADPVLINAEYNRADEPLDSAMVGLFNHCIAYLPATADRPGYYLDATADRNPVDYLRTDDQGARVLHVTPQGGEVHDIPYAAPAQNTMHRTYVVTLDAQGGGTVSMEDDSNGSYGVNLRYRYGGEKGDIEKNLSRELRGSFGEVTITKVDTSDLDDIRVPAKLSAEFSAQNLWTPEAGGRSLRLGFDDLGLQRVAAEPEAERSFDLVMDRPYAQDTTVTWKLPEGVTVSRLPRDVSVEAPGLLSYSLTAREVDGAVVVQRHFELLQRRIEVKDYAAFRNALRDVQLAEARTIAVSAPAEANR